jgi:hypothetical protein
MDLRVLGVVLVVVLAGCMQAPVGNETTATTEDPATNTTTATTTVTTTPSEPAFDYTDPGTDVLGWEQGFWYNETLPIDSSDGLNQTELDEVVARSMARVEQLRGLEFEEDVPVDVVSRETYRAEYASSSNTSPALRTFDNAKFEALFLVGEDRDSLEVQQSNRGSNVLGFYSPSEDRIVVVSESEEPQVTETTLGHELVHALQDQYFDLGNSSGETRDAHNARNGVVEGDARYVDSIYDTRCGLAWNCTTQSDGGGGGGDLHLGIYVMKYFPYSDGPGFVQSLRSGDDWTAVNDVYGDLPASAEQVIHPEKYGTDAPTNVSLPDESDEDWTRVSPPGRSPYGEVGQASLTAMFAYPAYDESRDGAVVGPREFLNFEEGGEVNSSDPINYDIEYTDGWDGDKLWVYENAAGEQAYTWRLVWDSEADAEEFAEGYRELLEYWGAEQVEGTDGVYRIAENESAFADAFYVQVEGDTVTIVNAPTVGDLSDVHAAAPE